MATSSRNLLLVGYHSPAQARGTRAPSSAAAAPGCAAQRQPWGACLRVPRVTTRVRAVDRNLGGPEQCTRRRVAGVWLCGVHAWSRGRMRADVRAHQRCVIRVPAGELLRGHAGSWQAAVWHSGSAAPAMPSAAAVARRVAAVELAAGCRLCCGMWAPRDNSVARGQLQGACRQVTGRCAHSNLCGQARSRSSAWTATQSH